MANVTVMSRQRNEDRNRIMSRDTEIQRLYLDGAPYKVIAEKVGLSTTGVFNRCRKLSLPLRVGRWNGK